MSESVKASVRQKEVKHLLGWNAPLFYVSGVSWRRAITVALWGDSHDNSAHMQHTIFRGGVRVWRGVLHPQHVSRRSGGKDANPRLCTARVLATWLRVKVDLRVPKTTFQPVRWACFRVLDP